jgi:uncharacterized membrane protein
MASKLALYFGLRKEHDDLEGARNAVTASLIGLADRVREFEKLLDAELRSAAPAVVKREAAAPSSPSREAAVQVRGTATSVSAGPPAEREDRIAGRAAEAGKQRSDLEVRVGQKWLLIAGLLTMVFGVGYFLKYSFEQGWVGPAGRVAMAYLWGAVFLVAGDRFRKRGLGPFGLSLSGGGIAVLYFAAFAAFQIYHLFDQVPSFSIMVLITVLAGLLAVRYDAKWLAVLGLAGGFLTPVLLSTGQDNQIALMTYMLVLNLGLLGVAFHKRWGLLNVLGFLFTYLLYTGWAFNHYAQHKFWPAIVFLTLFFLIYSIVPFAYQFFRVSTDRVRGFPVMLGNALLSFAFSYWMISERFSTEWVSVITILYALVFLGMASFLYRRGFHRQEAFVLLLAKTALFLVITIPVLFSKHWITIFWAVQAAVLLWAGQRLGRKSLVAGSYVLLAVALLKFLAHDYEAIFRFDVDYSHAVTAGYGYLIVERFITTAAVLGITYGAAVLAQRGAVRLFSDRRGDAPVLLAVFGVMLFIALNVETSAFFHDYVPDGRFAAISVLWTLYSVGLMLLGFRTNSATLRRVAIGLFGVTVLKVFLSDMANVSTPYRILSFIILGLVLVGTSYLYHTFRERILSAMAEPGGKGKE